MYGARLKFADFILKELRKNADRLDAHALEDMRLHHNPRAGSLNLAFRGETALIVWYGGLTCTVYPLPGAPYEREIPEDTIRRVRHRMCREGLVVLEKFYAEHLAGMGDLIRGVGHRSHLTMAVSRTLSKGWVHRA